MNFAVTGSRILLHPLRFTRKGKPSRKIALNSNGEVNCRELARRPWVIQTYSKDDADIYSNYRPVSELPSFSKILERLIFNRCLDHVEKHDILNEKQFRFRKNHSNYMAIFELIDKINNAVENVKQPLHCILIFQKLLILLIIINYFTNWNIVALEASSLTGSRAILVIELKTWFSPRQKNHNLALSNLVW